jgi:NADH dehydrogenase (ubiquinone) Fe-S protein 4
VHIKQPESTVGQSADNDERRWIISFMDEGEAAETWENPLMGWTSGADPMASNIQLQMSFRNAKEAVYFCQKRGWNYIVEEPILRAPGGAMSNQYQDNFLPKKIAAKVKAERTQCSQWERPKACASHYMRPLKYHGDGEVSQHGPNPQEKVAPHVEGCYKMR